jgi:putative IMPACT (imprinted ancient) family translation regulator
MMMERNNSAGMPIYGQIQSFGVTNVLLIAVRVFGVKLSVGLISATNYRTTHTRKLCCDRKND